VTYLQAAVTGLDLPDILGKKDWGEYNITHLEMRALEVSVDNVTVEVGEQVSIVIEDIGTSFEEFHWGFEKNSFPKVKDKGDATAQVVNLCVTLSFDIMTDQNKAVTVGNIVPAISLGKMDVQVTGGSHTWLYNKLLSVFGAQIKTVVEKELLQATTDGIVMLQSSMTQVTQKFFGGAK
jgi:hypothetical protein